MIDEDALTLACRNRMLSLVVCTTGSQTLSATATGYARAAGSFLADGFRDGMEFSAAGFATAGNNGKRVIESVAALAITTKADAGRYAAEGTGAIPQPTVEAPAAARTLSVGIPSGRAFDNKSFLPVAGRPYIEEDFVPGGHGLLSMPAQGGVGDEDGLYIIRWYGLEGKGEGGIRRPVNALKLLFSPGTVVVAAGIPVRMRGNPAVRSGQILPQGNGWATCTMTAPWRANSLNAIAV